MTPDRWQHIRSVLEASLSLAGPERAKYLDEVCAGEPGLREEIESLIQSYESGSELLDTPALATGAAAVMETVESSDVGRRIGPYELVEEVGRGGMGAVYRAIRVDDFHRQVAIKLIKRGFDTDFIVRRFRHERQIMAGLDHPNIGRLLDGGSTSDGRPYFVMEYIEGQPVDEYCDASRLSIRERLELFRTICSGVSYAHQRRVIHRDIKPGNILITPEGVPKLLDFGIAKIFSTGTGATGNPPSITSMRVMTPEYASPEQVRGDAVTTASDIYSLGVLLYELLSGRRPYRPWGRRPQDLAIAICQAEPEKPSTAVIRRGRRSDENVWAELRRPAPASAGLSAARDETEVTPESISRARSTDPPRLRHYLQGDLDNIVLMAMRKEPERRYASVEQFSEDIRRHLDGQPVIARRASLGYRSAKFFERHRPRVISGALILVAVLAGFYWTRQFSRPEPMPRVTPFTTYNGDETQPAFSPDGEKIAFTWGGPSGENRDIYIANVRGGGLLRLTTNAADDRCPVWSPDGKHIAFFRSSSFTETAIFVAPAENGTHRKVTDLFPARMDAASVEANGRPYSWSPDGKYLAIGDRTVADAPFSIFLVPVDGGERRRVTLPPDRIVGDLNPSFSPDGRQLCFVRSPSSGVSDLWIQPVDGGPPQRLTFDERDIFGHTWTPDGSYVVFASNRSGNYELWRVPSSGGAPSKLQGLGTGLSNPAFSEDGQKLVYAQFFLDTNIWQRDLQDPSEPARPLISSSQIDSAPQYSPDGSRIVLRSTRSGTHEIWVSDSEGLRAVQLTHFGGPLTGTPRWSPDGHWIAFDSRPYGQADIFIVSAGGGNPRRFTYGRSEDVVPSWSRDGQWIYFASNRSGAWQVWKKHVNGGEAVRVTHDGGFATFESVDGKHLYYAKGRGSTGIWRKSLPDGPEELVVDTLKEGFWGQWGLTASGIHYVEQFGLGDYGVLFRAFDRERPVILFKMRAQIRAGDPGFAVSPDGRYIAWTQVDHSGSDIMLADYSHTD